MPQSRSDGFSTIPEDFLRTAESINQFAQTVYLLKQGAAADAETKLSPDQCRSLIWGLKIMREGRDG